MKIISLSEMLEFGKKISKVTVKCGEVCSINLPQIANGQLISHTIKIFLYQVAEGPVGY